MRSVEPESLFAAPRSFHNLTREVLPRDNIRLVDLDEHAVVVADNGPRNEVRGGTPGEIAIADIANGIFSLSEIAFDKEHRHALVSYSFKCGLLCGSGMTVVYEKIGGEWKRTKLECGGWVS